jgi:hypothetical protein
MSNNNTFFFGAELPAQYQQTVRTFEKDIMLNFSVTPLFINIPHIKFHAPIEKAAAEFETIKQLISSQMIRCPAVTPMLHGFDSTETGDVCWQITNGEQCMPVKNAFIELNIVPPETVTFDCVTIAQTDSVHTAKEIALHLNRLHLAHYPFVISQIALFVKGVTGQYSVMRKFPLKSSQLR